MKKFYILFFLALTSCADTEEETPYYYSVSIINVTLRKIPSTSSANLPWDEADGPDIMFRLSEQQYYHEYSSYAMQNVNVSTGLPLLWQVNGFNLRKPPQIYDLTFYDKDSSAAIEMGKVSFTSDDLAQKGKFPPFYDLESGDGSLQVTLQLRW